MAGKLRHWKEKGGRFYARLAVPAALRERLGKAELIEPLGADRKQALKDHAAAVARLQAIITQADRAASAVTPASRYEMQPDAIALSHYRQRLAFDDELRQDHRYASMGYVDEHYVERLRAGMAGALSDLELASLIGGRVEKFRRSGNLTASVGTDAWRQIARALCVAEFEALSRVAERDEGDFTGRPSHPLIVDAKLPEDEPEPVKLLKLSEDYIASRTAAGFMKDNGKRHRSIVESLRKFLKHGDARQITKKALIEWQKHLMTKFSAKTVNDAYLSSIRSMMKWAFDNELLPENVAEGVRQPKKRKEYGRERGFTDPEAQALLSAAVNYQPNVDEYGRVRETPQSVATKRWVPLLCAFTGARVSEITQLRGKDVRRDGERVIIRITPDAGTVKAGGYRDVPLHRQVIDLGFEQFVISSGEGPLFHTGTDPKSYASKAQRMSSQLAEWLRAEKLCPDELQPNHGWRHRLKTQAMELGLNPRVIDAIQGHTGRTAGEQYGDVTLTAKTAAIDKLPSYQLQ